MILKQERKLCYRKKNSNTTLCDFFYMKNSIGTVNLEERNPNGGCLWEWRVRVARNLGTVSRGIEMVHGHTGYRCRLHSV